MNESKELPSIFFGDKMISSAIVNVYGDFIFAINNQTQCTIKAASSVWNSS